jgi:hypothetical protein
MSDDKMLDDKQIEQVACDEAQQDWDSLHYARIYEAAFIDGAKWMRSEAESHVQHLIDQAKAEQRESDISYFGAYLVDNHEEKFAGGENQIAAISQVVLEELNAETDK